MATNAELIASIKALDESANIEGKTNAQLAEMLKGLKAEAEAAEQAKAEAEAAEQAKAEADAAEQAKAEADAAEQAKAEAEAEGPRVAKGRSVITKRGIKGPDSVIEEGDLPDAALKSLIKRGIVVA